MSERKTGIQLKSFQPKSLTKMCSVPQTSDFETSVDIHPVRHNVAHKAEIKPNVFICAYYRIIRWTAQVQTGYL